MPSHYIGCKHASLLISQTALAGNRYGMAMIQGMSLKSDSGRAVVRRRRVGRRTIPCRTKNVKMPLANRDVRFLQTLANSMSVALENARFFDETQRLLKETEQRARNWPSSTACRKDSPPNWICRPSMISWATRSAKYSMRIDHDLCTRQRQGTISTILIITVKAAGHYVPTGRPYLLARLYCNDLHVTANCCSERIRRIWVQAGATTVTTGG